MEDWLQEFIDGVSGAADKVGSFLSSVGTDLGDAVDSISKAFSSSAPTTADQGYSYYGPAEVVANKVEAPGLLDRIESFTKKNPTLTKFGVGAVSEYAKGQRAEDAAEKLAQSRLNELREADRIRQERAAQYSSSVSGMARPGLMAQKPLTRVGGARVFSGGGLMAR